MMRPIEPPADKVSGATHHSSSKENLGTVCVMSHIEPPTDEVLLKPIVVQISLNGIRLPFQIDTGATYSVISTKTFHSFFARYVKPHMYHSTVTQGTYGKSAFLTIEGRFHANIVYNQIKCILRVMVTKELETNILDRKWLTPLGIRVEEIEEIYHLSSSDEFQSDNRNCDFLSLPAVTGVGSGRYNGPPIHLGWS